MSIININISTVQLVLRIKDRIVQPPRVDGLFTISEVTSSKVIPN